MSHKIARILIALVVLFATVYILSLGHFPSVGGHVDVLFLGVFLSLFIERVRKITSRGLLHISHVFAR